MKKRRKKSELAKRKEQLEELAKRYVRGRDKMICQKCKKLVQGCNAHCSHVHSKQAYPRLRYNKGNLKLLCGYCHIYWWHKNPIDAYQWFKQEFPHRYEYLEIEKQNQNKLTILDIEEMIDEYNDLLVGQDIRRNEWKENL